MRRPPLTLPSITFLPRRARGIINEQIHIILEIRYSGESHLCFFHALRRQLLAKTRTGVRVWANARKAEERAHILQGLIIAIDNLDEVIALIRGSQTPEEARNGLMEPSSDHFSSISDHI